MNAWRFVVAVPHGKRRSEQSVAAWRPALKSSVGAPEAWWTFVSSPSSGLRSPLPRRVDRGEHAGVVGVGELVLDDQVEELHAVHAVADEPRDVGGRVEAAGSARRAQHAGGRAQPDEVERDLALRVGMRQHRVEDERLHALGVGERVPLGDERPVGDAVDRPASSRRAPRAGRRGPRPCRASSRTRAACRGSSRTPGRHSATGRRCRRCRPPPGAAGTGSPCRPSRAGRSSRAGSRSARARSARRSSTIAGTPGWPGPPARKRRTPRGAFTLFAAATFRRSRALCLAAAVERHGQGRAGEPRRLRARMRALESRARRRPRAGGQRGPPRRE